MLEIRGPKQESAGPSQIVGKVQVGKVIGVAVSPCFSRIEAGELVVRKVCREELVIQSGGRQIA